MTHSLSPALICNRREKNTIFIVAYLVLTTPQLFSTAQSHKVTSLGMRVPWRRERTTACPPCLLQCERGGSSPDEELSLLTEDSNKNKEGELEEDVTKIPTLFQLPEENTYDRYAACLAATEGLRNVRERELSKVKERRGLFDGLLSRKTHSNSEAEVRAESKYILNSSKVIKALGMTIPQFNQVGREVMGNEELKEKVMEQAYIYRLSSNLSLPNNRVPILSEQMSLSLRKAQRRRRIQMFARSIKEIENLRTDQVEKLRRALRMSSLPESFNMCDPNVLPLLSPKVRAVCEAFPLQAEDIVRKYGLNSDEFNEMLAKAKKDLLFQWKVKKEMTSDG